MLHLILNSPRPYIASYNWKGRKMFLPSNFSNFCESRQKLKWTSHRFREGLVACLVLPWPTEIVEFVSRELLFFYLSDHVNIGKGRSHIMSPIEFTISVQFCKRENHGCQRRHYARAVQSVDQSWILPKTRVFRPFSAHLGLQWKNESSQRRKSLHEIYRER